MAPTQSPGAPTRARSIGGMLLIAAVGLIVGYVVLLVLEAAVELLWETIPDELDSPWRWVYAVAVPAFAGLLVFLARRAGDFGHSPLAGLSISPLTAAQYWPVIAAIAATLVGGLVLGPEVALVSTGAVIGTTLGSRISGVNGAKAVSAGVGGAVLALFLGPALNGSLSVSWDYQFRAADLLGAAGVAAVTAAALSVGRWAAIAFLRLRGGDRAHWGVLVAVGAIIGLIAALYNATTSEPLNLVLTSGEGQIRELVVLDAWGLVALTVALKLLTYALSQGSGFRGGPYFPAIFVGAGIGAVATMVVPDWFSGAAAAGIVAAVVYLARPGWRATVVLAVVLGVIAGGWQAIGLALVAAVVARLAPSQSLPTEPANADPESAETPSS